MLNYPDSNSSHKLTNIDVRDFKTFSFKLDFKKCIFFFFHPPIQFKVTTELKVTFLLHLYRFNNILVSEYLFFKAVIITNRK